MGEGDVLCVASELVSELGMKAFDFLAVIYRKHLLLQINYLRSIIIINNDI